MYEPFGESVLIVMTLLSNGELVARVILNSKSYEM